MSQTQVIPNPARAKRFAVPRLTAGGTGAVILLLIAAPCLLTLPWSLQRYDIQVFQPRMAPTLDVISTLKNPPAVASEIQGTVEYRTDDKAEWQAVTQGKTLGPGGKVRVSESGSASLQLGDTLIDIAAGTTHDLGTPYSPMFADMIMGSDELGRSVFWRCMLGGAISLGIGIAAAFISVFIGVMWGAMSGLAGGRTDAAMMRTVDILYGLPYILLVVLVKIAMEPAVAKLLMALFSSEEVVNGKTVTTGLNEASALVIASIITLLIAIGGVSWLTMSRVIRGQVLSLREQPFVEAARACGVKPGRILRVHLLPNLVGPIVVYTTLTVPTAILQESFLSFLGIGVQPPLPSWGNLASDGIKTLHALSLEETQFRWWMLIWPCTLLGMTLMALNFLGEALRNRVDPRSVKNN